MTKVTTRDARQDAAVEAWRQSGGKGLVVAATGFGKSKIVCTVIDKLLQSKPDAKVLWVVPTQKLRDVEVPNELLRWSPNAIESVEVVCYQGLTDSFADSYEPVTLVVLDEAHHITDRSADILQVIGYDFIIGVTATPPKERDKIEILDALRCWPIVFNVGLTESVANQWVANYDVDVVRAYMTHGEEMEYYQLDLECERLREALKPLNEKLGNLKTEYTAIEREHPWILDSPELKTPCNIEIYKRYQNLKNDYSRQLYYINGRPTVDLKNQYGIRARFVYNCGSKRFKIVTAARDAEGQTIVFAGSVEAAEWIAGELHSAAYHGAIKKKDRRKLIERFEAGEFRHLVCVKALDEGANISNVDSIVIGQCSSSERQAVQRVGRGIRYRDGHHCKVTIVCLSDTCDERWVKIATRALKK